jgi:hypothetical protein
MRLTLTTATHFPCLCTNIYDSLDRDRPFARPLPTTDSTVTEATYKSLNALRWIQSYDPYVHVLRYSTWLFGLQPGHCACGCDKRELDERGEVFSTQLIETMRTRLKRRTCDSTEQLGKLQRKFEKILKSIFLK